MKKNPNYFTSTSLLFCFGFSIALIAHTACDSEQVSEKQAVDYVNPFIGTKASGERKSTDGRTHPGACVPFGMTKWTPANIDNQSDPYKYVEDSGRMRLYPNMIKEEVFSFRGSHFPNGSHTRDYGSYDFMPVVGDLKFTTAERTSRISHDQEEASPGYYAVYLQDLKTDAELTATERCGYLRFSFPDTNQVHILVDTRMSDGFVKIIPEENRVIGYNAYSPFGRIKGYFVAEFSKEFAAYGVWDQKDMEGAKEVTGERVKAYVSFDTKGEETIEVKIGTSFIDFETADTNLESEIGTRKFADIRNDARQAWNEKLSRIEVEGGSEDDKIKFYTSLYLVHFEPRISSSGNRYYSTYDEKIHETNPGSEFYNDFSLWDTYRNKHALLTYLEPRIEGDMIQSLVEIYKQGGWIPKWPNPGYTSVMIGAPATPVIVDAYLKGIDNFEADIAYEGMRKNAMVKPDPAEFKHGMRFRGLEGIEYYKELGYVPADKESRSASKTLEHAFADWALAQMAKALGKEDDYKYFLERSAGYRYLYDTTVGYLRGRNSDGSWIEPYDPISEEDYLSKGPDFRPRQNYDYITEGTPLHWTWHVMHDPQGLIKLLGGKEKFIEKLEYSLVRGEDYNFGEWNPWYNQTNQPVMHATYLFNDAGAPWKTQKWIRAIMDKSYGTGPAGMIGNDDVGTMSAWYVFSAMGFYPVAPGELIYSIGSPVFDKVTIHLPEYLYGGKDFTIVAENNSAENKYIQSASLNGESLDKPWIDHEAIKNGSTLILQMGNTPNKSWGNPGSEKGYITLFDGKDISAWTTETGDWRIEEGVLVLKNKDDHNMVNSSYLWTRETFGDFVLELDFKVPDEPIYGLEKFKGEGKPGNSGVFIRVENKGDPVQTGIEIQVGTLKPGDELRRGSVGGIFDLLPPAANRYKPGEWNHYRITCQGSLLTVELNGHETASADLNNWVTARMNPDGSPNKFKRPLKEFAGSGYIGLQDHGTPAYYRNIRIKKLINK